jgi:multidrug efflux pump subunit AcrA (membrane-fusion protein)
MRSSGLKLTLGSVFACAAVAAGSVAFAAPDVFDENAAGAQSTGAPSSSAGLLASDEERGSTIPSDERELAFPMPGLISTISVKNGDVIKKGQPLAKQDTRSSRRRWPRKSTS